MGIFRSFVETNISFPLLVFWRSEDRRSSCPWSVQQGWTAESVPDSVWMSQEVRTHETVVARAPNKIEPLMNVLRRVYHCETVCSCAGTSGWGTRVVRRRWNRWSTRGASSPWASANTKQLWDSTHILSSPQSFLNVLNWWPWALVSNNYMCDKKAFQQDTNRPLVDYVLHIEQVQRSRGGGRSGPCVWCGAGALNGLFCIQWTGTVYREIPVWWGPMHHGQRSHATPVDRMTDRHDC